MHSEQEIIDADERAARAWYARNYHWHAKQIADGREQFVTHRAEHEAAFYAGIRHMRGLVGAGQAAADAVPNQVTRVHG